MDEQREYHSCNQEFWRVEEAGGGVHVCYQGADDVIRRLHCPQCPSDFSDAVLQTTPSLMVSPEDAAENEVSVARGFLVMSAYALKDGTRIWVLTEADRSATTILLPNEY